MSDKFVYKENELKIFDNVEDAKTFIDIIKTGRKFCQDNFNVDDWEHGDGSHTCEKCPLDKNNMCLSEKGQLYINAPDDLYELLKSMKNMLNAYGYDFKITKADKEHTDEQRENRNN